MERNKYLFLLLISVVFSLTSNLHAQCDFGGTETPLPKGWILNNQSAIREVKNNQELEIALVLYKDVTYRFQLVGDTLASLEFELYVKTVVPAAEGKEEHHSEKQILLSNMDEAAGDFILKNDLDMRVFVSLKPTKNKEEKTICKGLRLLEKK
jgi:hypothetical protein